MTSLSVVKERIHQSVAESVLSEIQSRQARWYYFLGKTLDFQGGGIEIPSDSLVYEASTRNDIIAIKAINAGDVSFVIPRIDWVSGTSYAMFDNQLDESVTNFYVVDPSTFNVYKCLDNNYSAASTFRPTNTDIEPFVTPDGYKWKFMYNIPLGSRNKFMTSGFIPVSNSLRNRFFSNGGIESISIENAGQGYTQNTTTLVIDGDGTGAILLPVIQSGRLVDVVIQNPGVGYTFANIEVESTRLSTVHARVTTNLSRGDINTPQALTETLAVSGTIDTILVTNQGAGYTTAPTVVITGNGSGCTATAVIELGRVTRINVTNPGSGYTFAQVSLVGSSTTTATARAIVSPAGGHGRNAITELRARSLMFYSALTNERVAGFEINNDYRQFGILRNPKTSEVSSRIVDTASTRHFNVVPSTPINIALFPIGAVLRDQVNAEYVVVSQQRSVPQVGSLATSGLVLFSAINKEILSGTTLTAVIGGATFTVGSVEDQSDVVAQMATCAYVITPAAFNSNQYPVDTILVANDRQFTVVSNDGTRLLVLPQDGGILSPGMVLNIINTTTSFAISQVINPAFDKNTGDMLFIDNRSPFSQTEDQTVTLRTVIQY